MKTNYCAMSRQVRRAREWLCLVCGASVFLIALARVEAATADPLLATVSLSGASGTKEYHDPDGWWQRIAYHCDLSVRLYGYFAGLEGSTEVYYLTKKEGTMRFWGTAEDHFFGSTEIWDFDDRRTFNLETPEGVLRFWPAEQRVVYAGFGLSFSAANGIRPYRVRIYGTNPPPTIRLYVELPSKWWFTPEYDFSPGTVVPITPDLEVLDAKMVTPTELGVGIRVRYPSAQDATFSRSVLVEADINGTPVRKEFDVTRYTRPGEYWGRVAGQQNLMYDLNGNFLPTTPLRIDLTEFGVQRFDDNVEFDVFAMAYSGTGLSSVSGSRSVTNLLPVVMLHGYIHEMLGFPVEGYPLPWWAGGNVFSYELAYKSLREFLVKNGYNNEDRWENYPLMMYRTYWDPHDFNYTDPPDATPEMLSADISMLLQEVWRHNYARKVNVVAHSFGGLVARHYAANTPSDVNKVITVGTPHLGATFLYQVAFGYPNKAQADTKTIVQSGPNAGLPNALLWTVPRYPAIEPVAGGGPITPPYANTLTQAKGAGVRYYALYEPGYSDTLWKVEAQPTAAGWYEVVRKHFSNGDGYILASSASAFADESCPVHGPKHAFMLNDPSTQARIFSLLSTQSNGVVSGNGSQSSFVRGRLPPSGSMSRRLTVPPGVAEAYFELDWPGSTMNLRLTDPTGRVIDSGWTNGTDGIQIEVGTNSLRYRIPAPARGEWNLEIIAVDVPPEGEDFLAMAHLLMPQALGERLAMYRTGDREVTLAWPFGRNFTLECAQSLASPTGWSVVTNVSTVADYLNTVTVEVGPGSKFYRLIGAAP
jgi:pimeloyl-ACP methyl ester carboxylesterase